MQSGSGKKGSGRQPDLVDLVLSWSIEDILDEERFADKVKKLPETFQSVEQYLGSFVFPLIEETRAELFSSLEAVWDAPFAEIIAMEESKKSTLNLSYDIDVNGWKRGSGLGGHEAYKPKSGDILLLSNMIPEAANDLLRHGTSYFIASVTATALDEESLNGHRFNESEKESHKGVRIGELNEESQKGLRIRVAKSIEVSDGMGNSLYAIFLSNLTTNKRIWKALSLDADVDSDNLRMIEAVLYPKTSANCMCNNCSVGQTDVWMASFYSDLIPFSLNASQMDAVVNAIADIQCKQSHTVKLIWGPPGTGKTKTTSALLWAFLDMNYRTIICAPTNVAVTQVCLRLLSLLKGSRGQDTENGFSCFSLGDVVLFGNKDRMSVDDDPQLQEIFLDHRVDRLAECFAPLSGWKHMLVSLKALLEDCVSQYHIHLENEEKMEPKEDKDALGFRKFLQKQFHAISLPLQSCIRNLQVHLTKTLISDDISANLTAFYDLLETFGNLLCMPVVSNTELEELFSPNDLKNESTDAPDCAGSSAAKSIDKTRKECLCIVRVLQENLHLPLSFAKDWIKSFCLRNATLIFCTASTAALLQYYGMEPLEVLVVDEAAQLKECESVIPFRIKGIQHAILIGDERQLPSVVNSKLSEEAGFGRSVFGRFGSLGYQKHLLNIQYRMHPAISAFPNAKFYDGQILDGSNVREANYERHYLQGCMYGPFSFINIADGREEKDDIEKSRRNMVEVAVVLKLVRSLFKSFVAWDDSGKILNIGVVSPYSAQVNAIQEKIGNQYERHNGFSLKVKSIDGFQGGEEDVVILSTVRSNSKGSIGFLANYNRTNVALTRARHSLWILGNAFTLERSGSVWEELLRDVRERGCFFNADEDKGLAKAILQVKNELNQLDDLMKPDSVLLNTARWKVLFSDDFRKSFAKIKYLQIKQAVIQLLLRLADGWRPKSKSLDFSDLYGLAKQCHVRGLYLVWMVDIVKDERYIQVLKVWDILPLTEIPKLAKRLDNIFAMYTDVYIEHCRRRYFEGKLEVPMSWNLGKDLMQRKKLYRSKSVVESDGTELRDQEYMENSRVSESLLLMKFYSLSSGVVKHLLTDNDGKEIDLPFELNDQEKEIIGFPNSTFILGRSGTGKTTVLTMKLIQREQQHLISSRGLYGVKDCPFDVACEKNELNDDAEVVKKDFLRQIFVTVSPKLCAAIRNQIHRLQSFTSGGSFSNSAGSTEMHDISDSLTDFMDIPDSFVDILQKHYPLVITFQKFLMMLDGTMCNSFFSKFHGVKELSMDTRGVSKSLPLQTLIRSKEVTYERFVATYWPHFNDELTKKLDPSMVFTQIISYIKGGMEAGGACDGKLKREDYVMLSRGRVSTLSSKMREKIYEVFIDYEKKKAANGEFDLSDFVTDLHHRVNNEGYIGQNVDFVYIDEVQDLTMRQVALFKYVCKNVKEGFIFAGDTAQTIARGIDFRFQDIKSLFYNEFLSEATSGSRVKEMRVSDIFNLSQNFRTHVGVLKLAQSVVDLLYRFFPSSIDVLRPETSDIYGEAPVILDSGNDENAIITIFGNSGSTSGGASGFGADQVILVRDDFAKKQIIDDVGKQALVLTIVECKGLEFQDVLLYNFFSTSPLKNRWRVIYEYMQEQHHLDPATSRFPRFDVSKHSILCSELKQLYVAITRTRQRLWICDSIDDFCKPMFAYWKKLCLVQVRELDNSLAQAMRAISTAEDWKLRGIKLFNEGNFEMATMCFERAGDEFREKWAKAAGHRATAERILSTNFELARTAFIQAAEIYESIGKPESAADCFLKLKEYKKAGMIYLEKCGVSRLGNAGDCFAMAECWSLAAEVYARGKYFVRCLEACTKGELFELGLQFIKQWEADSYSDGIRKNQEVDDIRTTFLKNCAVHYFELGDTKCMMKFVKFFPSMDLVRSFLKSRNFIDELLAMEMESGNYLEAAEIARMKGDLLLEAEMLVKAGHLEIASNLIIRHVVMYSLWADRNKGWPLKQFLRKEQLLVWAKSLAEQASNEICESIRVAADILSDQTTHLLNLSNCFNTVKKFQNVQLQVLSARKILDIHLMAEPSKFHWESEEVVDLGKHVNQMVSQDLISVKTLMYFWNLWKEVILNFLSYLQLPGKAVAEDESMYEEFCLVYFGVHKQDDQNAYIALNSEAYWVKGCEGYSLQWEQNMVRMNAHQVMSCAQNFWASELPSVGIRVLEKLESLHSFATKRSLSLFCRGEAILYIFDIAKFLNESKLLDLKCFAGRLRSFLDLSKRCFPDIVFPLNCGSSVTENMVAMRENTIARNLLDEILVDNLGPKNHKLTHRQIGWTVMLLLNSGSLTECYLKISDMLDQMPLWKAFIEQLMTPTDRVFWLQLVSKLQEALASTFNSSWMQNDYMSPHCFMYLAECLLFLASSCQGSGGFVYTTKLTLFEMASSQVWKGFWGGACLPPTDVRFRNIVARSMAFLVSMAENLLSNKQSTRKWVRMHVPNSSSYYPLLVARLFVILVLAHLNSGWNFSRILNLLQWTDILSDMHHLFSKKLQRVNDRRYRGQFLQIFAEALEETGNRLVVMCSGNRHLETFNLNALIVITEGIQSRDDVINLLFPKAPKSIQCTDIKREELEGNSNSTHSASVSDTHRDDSKATSNLKISNEMCCTDLQTKYSHFWETFSAFKPSESGEPKNAACYASKSPQIKESIQVLDAATALLSQKGHQLHNDENVSREINDMLVDLKQLSDALDMSDEEVENHMSTVVMLFDKLQERRPRLQPVLDTLFLPSERSTPEINLTVAALTNQSQGNQEKIQEETAQPTTAPSNQSEANKVEEDNINKKRGTKKDKRKSLEVVNPATAASNSQSQGNQEETQEETAPPTSAPSNQSKGDKGTKNNKSKQKKRPKNKKK